MSNHIFDADNVLDACRKCGEWVNHDIHDISIKEIKPIVIDVALTPYEIAEANSKTTRKIEVCSECGSSDIQQQVTFMFNPNEPTKPLDWNDGQCDDYYWCRDCGDECDVEYKDA